jgi:hypothetical protein
MSTTSDLADLSPLLLTILSELPPKLERDAVRLAGGLMETDGFETGGDAESLWWILAGLTSSKSILCDRIEFRT